MQRQYGMYQAGQIADHIQEAASSEKLYAI